MASYGDSFGNAEQAYYSSMLGYQSLMGLQGLDTGMGGGGSSGMGGMGGMGAPGTGLLAQQQSLASQNALAASITAANQPGQVGTGATGGAGGGPGGHGGAGAGLGVKTPYGSMAGAQLGPTMNRSGQGTLGGYAGPAWWSAPRSQEQAPSYQQFLMGQAPSASEWGVYQGLLNQYQHPNPTTPINSLVLGGG